MLLLFATSEDRFSRVYSHFSPRVFLFSILPLHYYLYACYAMVEGYKNWDEMVLSCLIFK